MHHFLMPGRSAHSSRNARFRVGPLRACCLGCGLAWAGCVAIVWLARPSAAAESDLETCLARPILAAGTSERDVQAFVERRLPRLPRFESVAAWESEASGLRQRMLDQVVYRGEATRWRDADLRVEWLDTIPGGPGYVIKKLRYEALPGLWVPALLYEPEQLLGRVAVAMNVNGHDANGKSADYKQIRCINQAKRGMLALNVEWLGMGQLRGENYHHGRMNQLDLCGTSGLAPFYLVLKRGLDVLLAHPNADPGRVAVAGLSGGGWQTILISALDTRVTLANPVAGYSSFLTRLQHPKDLGDSEQTPCDMATVADYTHLTALLAPRPALLTYNAQDDCCFESGYTLPPLLEVARPIYRLYDKEPQLRQHVNHDPGTHNFFQDNREALYGMLADHFARPGETWQAAEIPSEAEVKTAEELRVELPVPNADFHSLAVQLAARLPAGGGLPTENIDTWQASHRAELRAAVRWKELRVTAAKAEHQQIGDDRVTFWELRIADAWTVPAVEIARGEPRATVILVADGGRVAARDEIAQLLAAGNRVVAVDPFCIGESAMRPRGSLWALLVATVGDRPLGIQASQLDALAAWIDRERHLGAPRVVGVGPRSSLISLVAAANRGSGEGSPVAGLQLYRSYGSLRQVIDDNGTLESAPELYCFGLLQQTDVPHLAALVAPRPVEFHALSQRAREELAHLPDVYPLLGDSQFEPLP